MYKLMNVTIAKVKKVQRGGLKLVVVNKNEPVYNMYCAVDKERSIAIDLRDNTIYTYLNDHLGILTHTYIIRNDMYYALFGTEVVIKPKENIKRKFKKIEKGY